MNTKTPWGVDLTASSARREGAQLSAWDRKMAEPDASGEGVGLIRWGSLSNGVGKIGARDLFLCTIQDLTLFRYFA
jgi:hypothetical protein